MSSLHLTVRIVSAQRWAESQRALLSEELGRLVHDLTVPVVLDLQLEHSTAQLYTRLSITVGPHNIALVVAEGTDTEDTRIRTVLAFFFDHPELLLTDDVLQHTWQLWSGGDQAAPTFVDIARRLARFRLRIDRMKAAVPRWHELDSTVLFEDALCNADRMLQLELHPDTHAAVAGELTGSDTLKQMGDGIAYELGIYIGQCELIATRAIEPDQIRVRINDMRTQTLPLIRSDECLVNGAPDVVSLFGPAARSGESPANPAPHSVVAIDTKQNVEALGYTTWTAFGYAILQAVATIRRNAHCFISLDIVAVELAKLHTAFPVLIGQARDRLGVRRIAMLLRQLLSEELSARDLVRILDCALTAPLRSENRDDYITFTSTYPTVRPQLTAASIDGDPDIAELAEYVRAVQRRYVTHKYVRGNSTLRVYLLHPELENLLRSAPTLSPHERDLLIDAIDRTIPDLHYLMREEWVFLTTATCRLALKNILHNLCPQIAVVSYPELTPETNIEKLDQVAA